MNINSISQKTGETLPQRGMNFQQRGTEFPQKGMRFFTPQRAQRSQSIKSFLAAAAGRAVSIFNSRGKKGLIEKIGLAPTPHYITLRYYLSYR
jgi:hypothetical protein